MKIDNGYPYNFNLNEIEEMVNFFLKKGQPEKALFELDQIEDSYFKNRNKIDRNRRENSHLMGYSFAGLFLENPDPTKITDYFHFQLRKMITEVEAKRLSLLKPKDKGIAFVAHYLFYSEASVTRENVDEIAIEWGFKNGDKLIQAYNKVIKHVDRTADPESLIKLRNKIQLFEKVRDYLKEDERDVIINDLKEIQDHLTRYQ